MFASDDPEFDQKKYIFQTDVIYNALEAHYENLQFVQQKRH